MSTITPDPEPQNQPPSASYAHVPPLHDPQATSTPPPNYSYSTYADSGEVSFETQKTLALLAHVGGVFLSWLVPLVVFLIYPKDKAPWLNQHAKEALNFQIALFIGYIVSTILMFIIIGFFTFFALWIYSLVASILAAVAASRGEEYRYSFNIRLIS